MKRLITQYANIVNCYKKKIPRQGTTEWGRRST